MASDERNTASTGAAALEAFERDPLVRSLMVRVGRMYPGEEGQRLLQDAIEATLSTSVLTAKHGINRPGGLEFFKLKLTAILRGFPGKSDR